MIMLNEEWQFGKCPICGAIVSLDPSYVVLCDRCHGDRSTSINMLINEDNQKGIQGMS